MPHDKNQLPWEYTNFEGFLLSDIDANDFSIVFVIVT